MEERGTPAYEEEYEEVITEKRTIYIEDIIDVALDTAYSYDVLSHLDKIIESADKTRYVYEYGEPLKQHHTLYRECRRFANQLIILCMHVIERNKRLKTYGARGRYYSAYYGSIPRKTMGWDLSEFLRLTRYSEKKGLVQLYYHFLINELQTKYSKMKKVYPAGLSERKSVIQDQLRKLSYTGKSDPQLEQELAAIEQQFQFILKENNLIEANYVKERQLLLEEEKEVIKEILVEISNCQSIRDHIVIPSISKSDTNYEQLRDKLLFLLIENKKQYKKQLSLILASVTDWKAVNEDPQQKQEIQQRVNQIKKPFMVSGEAIVSQINQEVQQLVNKNLFEPLERLKTQVDLNIKKLENLSKDLKAQFDDYTAKVTPFIEKEGKLL